MIRTKRDKKHIYLLVLLLLLGIGFAALAATLKINGTITIDSARWDVHFENVSVTPGSVTATTVPVSDNTTTTEMTYAASFTQPGDYYEFTTDIANDGTINAMVDLVTNKTYQADGETEKQLPAYLKSTVTYNDGTPINKNHLLAKQTSEKIKVRVEFKTDVNPGDLPSSAETTVFKFVVKYKQADKNACQRPTTFQADSWDTIQCNVRNNPLSYPLGAEKTIEIDIDGDNTNETYTLRVANNTTPAECSTQGFSQTACGFVVEFKEIIDMHRMNLYYDGTTNGDGAHGGWEYSDMRAYLNDGIYAKENIDYSNNGIYSKLPSELQNVIITTTVVSSHGYSQSDNFTTTDKLYLLSPAEIWEQVPGYDEARTDTAWNLSRQLDYYHSIGVTTSSYSNAKKNYKGYANYYWLRAAYSGNNDRFNMVSSTGYNYQGYYSASRYGVSPAFRIG